MSYQLVRANFGYSELLNMYIFEFKKFYIEYGKEQDVKEQELKSMTTPKGGKKK